MSKLPERPSREHLRKQAKRLARERGLRLAEAQLALARDYAFRSWPELIAHAARVNGDRDALYLAVRAGDVAAVRELLASGVNPQIGNGREAPLHAAARRGPFTLVEALVEGGALEWQPDETGRTPLDVARTSRASDRAAIVALLDRSAISDRSFRAAVDAIHAGDVVRLARLLDAEPRLLHERIAGPEAYRKATRAQYFRDPKLFWFVANNPTQVERMAPNVVDVARLMIERGVERSDLDYTLALTMSCTVAREQGHQRPLIRALLDGGARVTDDTIETAAAHCELDALRALLESGYLMTLGIAAALGDEASLRTMLPGATSEAVQTAFGLAAINQRIGAVRLTLDAGADVDARMPIHRHATALHQAALGDNVAFVELLLARGARTDVRDTLWDGTPLDWSIHENRPAARAALEKANVPSGAS